MPPLALFMYLLLSGRFEAAQDSRAITDDGSAPIDISVCEAIANPARLDNTRVRVTGFIAFSFETFSLWSPECSRRSSDFDAWLTYGGDVAGAVQYCCPGEANDRSEPLPYPIVKDQTLLGFRNLLAQERDTVVRATVVGRFLAHPPILKPIDRITGGGYGHFGCCSLLIIERVESFDPHGAKDVDYSAFSGSYAVDRALDRCEDAGLDHSFRTTDDRPFISPVFDGGTRFIAQQVAADNDTRAWALTDPGRVALESIREVRPAANRVESVASGAGWRIYEWRRDGLRTVVLVSRPYWLSMSARSSRIAWVVLRRNTVRCRWRWRLPGARDRATLSPALGILAARAGQGGPAGRAARVSCPVSPGRNTSTMISFATPEAHTSAVHVSGFTVSRPLPCSRCKRTNYRTMSTGFCDACDPELNAATKDADDAAEIMLERFQMETGQSALSDLKWFQRFIDEQPDGPVYREIHGRYLALHKAAQARRQY